MTAFSVFGKMAERISPFPKRQTIMITADTRKVAAINCLAEALALA